MSRPAQFTIAVGAVAAVLVGYACGGDGAGEATTTPIAEAGLLDVNAPLRDPDAAPLVDPPRGSYDAAVETVSELPILINEISGNAEWVELVNATDAGVDLAGYVVADRDKNTGKPKPSEAVTFPPGTTLGAGRFLLVYGKNDDGGAICSEPDGGALCFSAAFGISNKDGETIFLLAPSGVVVGQAAYPRNAAPKGSSYARLPSADPDASFDVAKETPGAPNVK